MNAERAYIDERLRAASLDMIQFSGDEDDATLAGWPVPSIITRRMKPGGSVTPPRADYVLFDAFDPKLTAAPACAFRSICFAPLI